MARIRFYGNLGQKPVAHIDKKDTKKIYYTFSVGEGYKFDKDGVEVKQTEWHNCITFGERHKFSCELLDKGSKVLIKGTQTPKNYINKLGEEVKSYSIVVDEIWTLEGLKSRDEKKLLEKAKILLEIAKRKTDFGKILKNEIEQEMEIRKASQIKKVEEVKKSDNLAKIMELAGDDTELLEMLKARELKKQQTETTLSETEQEDNTEKPKTIKAKLNADDGQYYNLDGEQLVTIEDEGKIFDVLTGFEVINIHDDYQEDDLPF